MDNHAYMGWDDISLVGENGSGFIELDGSQLGGFNGGLPAYLSHQSSLPMMNMYQQSHPTLLVINRNL